MEREKEKKRLCEQRGKEKKRLFEQRETLSPSHPSLTSFFFTINPVPANTQIH